MCNAMVMNGMTPVPSALKFLSLLFVVIIDPLDDMLLLWSLHMMRGAGLYQTPIAHERASCRSNDENNN